MSIVAWIIVGLIPGFLAGALAAHNRQTVRVRSDNPTPDFTALIKRYRYCENLRSFHRDKTNTGL
jgi:hypothetical protein